MVETEPPSLPPFFLTLELLEGGSDIKAEIVSGDQSVTLWVWCVTDALGDLARATTALLKGAVPTACFEWWEEPGLFEWRLTRAKSNVQITIHSVNTRKQKRVVLECTVSLHRFASGERGDCSATTRPAC